MNVKRDCFNNRKNQNAFSSRADRAVTWRGRGGNSSNNYNGTVVKNEQRDNHCLVMNENMGISSTEARWNSIPNRLRTPRQNSMVPFIDENLNFQANFHPTQSYSKSRNTRAPPPGITPLYNMPCLPSSSNIWSSSFDYEEYENNSTTNNRMQRPELPNQQRVHYLNNPLLTIDENANKFLPSSSSYRGHIKDSNKYSLLDQSYTKKRYEYNPNLPDHIKDREQNWMPLQSIDSNTSSRSFNNMNFTDNSMIKNYRYPPRSKDNTNINKSIMVKDENINPSYSSSDSTTDTSSKSSNHRTVTPRSWSQVVSSSESSNRDNTRHKENDKNYGGDYERYTSKDVHELSVVENSKITQPTCSVHALMSPPLSDSQQQQNHTENQQLELIEHCNALTISVSPPVYDTSSPILGTRYLSDSLGFILSAAVQFREFPEQRPYTILRVANIPWSISSEDILNLIKNTRGIASPSTSELPQSVHIIMDPKSGKTCGEAFVEVIIANKDILQDILSRLPIYPVQGRHLRFTESGYDDLRNHLFKNWKGTFKHGVATSYETEETEDNSGLGPLNNECTLFIGQKELQGLLNVCRNYKIFYNRKCPERSFEYLMSIVLNIPWLQKRCVTTIQRDILYECYKLVTESLRIHTSKALHSFDSKLMSRIIRAALTCNGFTVKQKQVILKNSQQRCPIDLLEYIQDPIIEPLNLPLPELNRLNRLTSN